MQLPEVPQHLNCDDQLSTLSQPTEEEDTSLTSHHHLKSWCIHPVGFSNAVISEDCHGPWLVAAALDSNSVAVSSSAIFSRTFRSAFDVPATPTLAVVCLAKLKAICRHQHLLINTDPLKEPPNATPNT